MSKIIKIAVIKSGAAGDLIMTTPALKSLRSVYPDAVIDLFCGGEYAHVLKNNPYITNICPMSLTTVFRGSPAEKIREASRIVNRLRGYDISYTLNTDNRWHMLSFLAGIPVRYGCSHGRTLFTENICICSNSEHRAALWVDTVMQNALRGAVSMSYEFFPDESYAVLPHKKYIAVAPGGGNNVKASYPQKIWDKFDALIEKILAETVLDIALLGTAEDVISIAPSDRITDYRGLTTLSDCFRIIAGAVRFVGNDSGLMHLAACTKTPITAVYGATDHTHTRPFNNPLNNIVTSHLPCSPCEKRGRFGCSVNDCMKSISVEEVFEAVSV